MAGGTGGHVYPALAVALALRDSGFDIEWLGTRNGLEARVVPEAGLHLNYLRVAGFRGKGVVARIKAMLLLFVSMLQSATVLIRFRPGCVLGMGGYAAAPGGIMSWLLRRPLVIHEQNAVAGSTNRLLAPLAQRVCVAYPDAFGDDQDVIETGNPVRSDIVAFTSPAEQHNEDSGPLRVLVLGGSLGAQALNETMPALLTELPPGTCELWHQCGPKHIDSVKNLYGSAPGAVKLEAYVEDMAAAYRWADLAVCRAGALTCAELAIAGVPAILIPLPGAIDDHQTANAGWLEQGGAAKILPQQKLSPAVLADEIRALASNRETLASMSNAARTLGRPNAVEDISAVCREVYRGA